MINVAIHYTSMLSLQGAELTERCCLIGMTTRQYVLHLFMLCIRNHSSPITLILFVWIRQ